MTATATSSTPPGATGTPAASAAPASGATAPPQAEPAAPPVGAAPEWYVKETARLREEKRAAEERAGKYEADAKAAAEKKLAEEKRFEELARTKAEEASAALKQVEQLKAERAQVFIRARLGVLKHELIDPEDIKAFDTSAVKCDENDNVSGLDEAWAAFREKKVHYFKAAAAGVPGAPSSPSALHPASAGARVPPKDPRDMTPEEWQAELKAKTNRLRGG